MQCIECSSVTTLKPIATEAALMALREREGVFVTYADRATRLLALTEKVMPLGFDSRHTVYYRRYVCHRLGGLKPSRFSVGVCDPFEEFLTPVWIRCHHATIFFAQIRDRLSAAGPALRIVESDSNVRIPLDVPLGAEAKTVVDSLVDQTERVIAVARSAP